MTFPDLEQLFSSARMNKYLSACGGIEVKALELYKLNLKASKELFSLINGFEVILRNRIDQHYILQFGNEWLKTASTSGFLFNKKCKKSAELVIDVVLSLEENQIYSHDKVVAQLSFSFWRYLFDSKQFQLGGSTLLNVFPKRTPGQPGQLHNHTYVYNKLEKINNFRNRIAHHEPICFDNQGQKDSHYIKSNYNQILLFLNWMDINDRELMKYLQIDVDSICLGIDNL